MIIEVEEFERRRCPFFGGGRYSRARWLFVDGKSHLGYLRLGNKAFPNEGEPNGC